MRYCLKNYWTLVRFKSQAPTQPSSLTSNIENWHDCCRECGVSEGNFRDIICTGVRRLFLIARVISIVVNLVKRLPPYHEPRRWANGKPVTIISGKISPIRFWYVVIMLKAPVSKQRLGAFSWNNIKKLSGQLDEEETHSFLCERLFWCFSLNSSSQNLLDLTQSTKYTC